MLIFFFNSLRFFRSLFSRERTWLLFCMVIIGFIGSFEVVGVSSFCRFWGTGTNVYIALLNFFRSNAWSLNILICQWATFVLQQNVVYMLEHSGQAVLFGDHTYVAKNGRRMPGVVTIHQESETQSKPSYFRGHYWGAIGILIGTLNNPFCLPLALAIHQGLIHIGKETNKGNDNQTLGCRIVQMALDFSSQHSIPCILVLDAFFPTASVFNLANSVWSLAAKQPLLRLIVRAKKSYVAYHKAKKPEGKKPVGAPKKYGKKEKLMELFDQKHLFSKKTCKVYNKVEEVSIMTLNLLWKPTRSMIRFVFAVTSRGPIILMCSDLNQDPIIALELYCARVRIETMFDKLKNVLHVFQYRFWSKLMPVHSRSPKKNQELKKPSTQELPTVKQCWYAYELFVMIGAIALGFLQLIACKYTKVVWNNFNAFLRTRSREIPSENTVKIVINNLLLKNIVSFAPDRIIRKIKNNFHLKSHN